MGPDEVSTFNAFTYLKNKSVTVALDACLRLCCHLRLSGEERLKMAMALLCRLTLVIHFQ